MSELSVHFKCKCGCDFFRTYQYVLDCAEYRLEYEMAYKHHFDRINMCDKCWHNRVMQALKILPDILKSLVA